LSLTIVLSSFIVIQSRGCRACSCAGRRRWWSSRGHRCRCRLGLSGGNGGGRRRRRGGVVLNKLNVVAREQAALSPDVGSHPPVIVHHVDVGDILSLDQVNFVILSLFIIILHQSALAALLVVTVGYLRSVLKRLLGHGTSCGSCKVASFVLVLKLLLSGNWDFLHREGRRCALLGPLDCGLRAASHGHGDTDWRWRALPLLGHGLVCRGVFLLFLLVCRSWAAGKAGEGETSSWPGAIRNRRWGLVLFLDCSRRRWLAGPDGNGVLKPISQGRHARGTRGLVLRSLSGLFLLLIRGFGSTTCGSSGLNWSPALARVATLPRRRAAGLLSLLSRWHWRR
jgi:hypothetical protein